MRFKWTGKRFEWFKSTLDMWGTIAPPDADRFASPADVYLDIGAPGRCVRNLYVENLLDCTGAAYNLSGVASAGATSFSGLIDTSGVYTSGQLTRWDGAFWQPYTEAATGSESLSGLVDVQTSPWTSGHVVAWNGTLFVPTTAGGSSPQSNVSGHFQEQFTATDTIAFNHSLGSYPQVTVLDSVFCEQDVQVCHDDTDNTTLTFNGTISGWFVADIGLAGLAGADGATGPAGSDGADGADGAAGAIALSGLTDDTLITVGALVSGQHLSYNGTQWVNAEPAAAIGAHSILGSEHTDATGTATTSGQHLSWDGDEWRPRFTFFQPSGYQVPSGDYATVSQGHTLWKSATDFFQPSGYQVPSGNYATVDQGHNLWQGSGLYEVSGKAADTMAAHLTQWDHRDFQPRISGRYIASFNQDVASSGFYTGGIATSEDGRKFIIRNNYAIPQGNGGAWDATHIRKTNLIVDVSGVLSCFYEGYNGSNWKIGVTRSYDGGVTWAKYSSNPIITNDVGWEGSHVQRPVVLYDLDAPATHRYKMWYAGAAVGDAIGFAYSADGLSWTKYASNPVLVPGFPGEWDDTYLLPGAIVKRGKEYVLLYNGNDGTGTWSAGKSTFVNPESKYERTSGALLAGDGFQSTLNASVTSGDIDITVVDSRIFPVGCPVWVVNPNGADPRYGTWVERRVDQTTLRMHHGAGQSVATGAGAVVKSMAFNSVTVESVLYEDGGYRLYLTAFQPDPPDNLSETAMMGWSHDLSEMAIDYSAHNPLDVNPDTTSQTNTNFSRENMSVISLWTEDQRQQPPLLGSGLYDISGVEHGFDTAWGDARYAASGTTTNINISASGAHVTEVFTATDLFKFDHMLSGYPLVQVVDSGNCMIDVDWCYSGLNTVDITFLGTITNGRAIAALGGPNSYSGLIDTQAVGWTSGNLTRYNGSQWVPFDGDLAYAASGNFAPSGHNIEQHGDYTRLSPLASGHQIGWNGTNWVNTTPGAGGGGASALADLSDVNLGTLVSGHVLAYNGTEWINSSSVEAAGGGGPALNVTKAMVQTKTLLEEWTAIAADTVFESQVIPSGYDEIRIEWAAQVDNAGVAGFNSPNMALNGDNTDANYHYQYRWNANNSETGAEASLNDLVAAQVANHAAASYGYGFIRIPDYASSTRRKAIFMKAWHADTTDELNNVEMSLTWDTVETISGVTLSNPSLGFVAGSQYRIYGIKDENVVTDVTGTQVVGSGVLVVQTKTVQTRTLLAESGVSADTPDWVVSGLTGYDHLEFIFRAATDRSSQVDTVWVSWNNDGTTTNYNFFQGLTGDGETHSVGDSRRIGGATAATRSNTNSFGHTHGIISYVNRSDRWKSGTFQYTEGAGAGFDFLINGASMWESLEPISTARFTPGVGTNFISGSHFQIFGIKEEAVVTSVSGTGTDLETTAISGGWDVDLPATTFNGRSDRFDTAVLSGQWTENDQSSITTLTPTPYGLEISGGTASTDLAFLHTEAPAGDEYTVIGKFSIAVSENTASAPGWLEAGVAIMEDMSAAPTTAGAAIITVRYDANQSIDRINILPQEWTDFDTFSASLGFAANAGSSVSTNDVDPSIANTYYLRMRKNGSNYGMDFSHDGRNWQQQYSGTISTVSTAADVGLVVRQSNIPAQRIYCEWFSCVDGISDFYQQPPGRRQVYVENATGGGGGGGGDSFPTPVTSGDIAVYDGTNWVAGKSAGTIFLVDAPPEIPGQADDEFDIGITPTLSGAWTFWDPGTGVSQSGMDEAGYYWVHDEAGAGANSYAGIIRPVPTGSSWQVMAKISFDIYDDDASNQPMIALALLDTDALSAPTTANFETILLDARLASDPHFQRIIQADYSSYTTFDNNAGIYHDVDGENAGAGSTMHNEVYFRVAYNGTTTFWHYSWDGVSWTFLDQQTAWTTPTYCGILSNHIGATSLNFVVRAHWFRSIDDESNISLRPPTGRRVKLWAG